MADSTNAQIGSKTTLAFWDESASPDAYTPLGQVKQFGEVGSDKPEVDTTDLDSDGVERIGGLPDGKEISIVCYANASTVPLFESFNDEGDNLDLKMTFPAPLSLSRYFFFAPLGISYGTVTASGVVEVTMRGRISGAIASSAPTH